jgi:hypothetical protein
LEGGAQGALRCPSRREAHTGIPAADFDGGKDEV